MSDKNYKIELHSEEIREILGHVPHWIIRWGLLLFLISFLLIIIGSWIFKYPDILKAEIFITTENPPYQVIARSDGRIEHLFVKDNEEVKRDQILALIENPSVFKDVLILKSSLDSFRINNNSSINEYLYHFSQNLVLGDIQSYYANFLKLFEDINKFILLDYHNQKIASLEQEINKYENYSQRLRNQNNILVQEEKLSLNQLNRDSLLFIQGLIPEADYEKTKSILLQKRFNLEQSLITLASNDIEVSKLEQQILDLRLQRNQEKNKLELAMNEAYDNLLAQISLWEQKYVMQSPVQGVVSFTRIWSENQNVRNGDVVMSVIPEDQGEVIGKINLPVAGSGKVKPGQSVNIKFSNFPHIEYGMVRGTIRSISLVAQDRLYSAVVQLNEGLRTNYGITLDFNQDMHGIAEIITDDKRLLERVVYPVKAVISKQKGL